MSGEGLCLTERCREQRQHYRLNSEANFMGIYWAQKCSNLPDRVLACQAATELAGSEQSHLEWYIRGVSDTEA